MFKNTLARRAVEDAGLDDLSPMLEGPVAIAFVQGDAVDRGQGAARLRPKTNPALVVKGGLLGTRDPHRRPRSRRSPSIQPRDVLLARLAGGFQAPLTKAAGLFQAFTRNFAYGVKASSTSASPAARPLEAAAEPRRPRRRGRSASRRGGRGRATDAEAPAAEADEAAAEAPASRAPSREQPSPRPSDRSNEERADMATMTTDELLDVFKNMTVLELNEFLKAFEEEFGVTAAAPVAVAAGPGRRRWRRGRRGAEEQDEFDVILTAAGDKKIQVIKEVRALDRASG